MNSAGAIEFLKEHVSFLQGFPEDKLKELVEGSRITTFEANEAVIEFGSEGRFLGVVLDGDAEVSVADDTGRRHRINVLRPGDVFGEMSLMTGDKTMADVIGVSRCEALLIPSALFSSIVVTHPPAVINLSKIITNRLKTFAYEEEGQKLAASAFRKSRDPYGMKLRTDTPMKLLVVNCGSSSLKYNLFDTSSGKEDGNARGVVEKIGEEGTRHTYRSSSGEVTLELARATHAEAFSSMIEALTADGTGVLGSPNEIDAVGHRVVHGADTFSNSVIIDDAVEAEIDSLSSLAPLHNPVNLTGIREARKIFPDVPHVAVFDTSFHHTLPPYAYLYGLPYEYYEKKQIRRYGFHGMSHAYVSLKAAEFLRRSYKELEIATCHLGNGASVCAVDHGRSIDTSMGLTPTEGLIMGTRCGDVDPAVLVHLMRTENLNADELDRLINKESGLKGLSGVSNDMREVEAAAQEGNHQALLAFKTFCYHIRKYIGSYLAAMGGLDVLVFTGGIGQGSAGVRSLACQGLECMGIHIDEEKNRHAGEAEETYEVSADDSDVRVLVIPTDEERMIAREMLGTLSRKEVSKILRRQESAPIPVEVSAHHVHLCQEDIEGLFGKGHQLTSKLELSQPGQYACEEQVNLIGSKGRVERVRVLGPARKATQVEISMTEQFKLGIQPPIRGSGDIANTPGIILEGTEGRSVEIREGVICALRHIHMAPEDALRFGLRDKDMVRVRVEGARELIFGDVLIRISPKFKLAMHIDTDEANAASLKTGAIGHVDGIQSRS